LYGVGTGNALDCSNVLNDSNCVGYAAAYLTQQCDIDSLYSTSCTGYAAAYLTQQCDIDDLYSQSCTNYWSAYDDQQCDEDPQYSPSCQGYQQEESVAYYAEETDYGYTEEDMWYDEEYDEWLDPNDPCYENRCEGFSDADWYELDVEQFGQEQVDNWYGEEVEFTEEGNIEYGSTSEEEYWTAIDDGMDVYDIEQEDIRVAEELAWEEHIEYIEEFVVVDEITLNQVDVVDVLDAEELIELYEFDTIIREELDYEEEIFAIREEVEELEEEMEELREEEFFELEEEMEERLAEAEHEEENEEKERSSVRINALDVVAGTLRTAESSVVESEDSTSESVEVSVNNYTSNELFNTNFNAENTSSSAVINFNNPSSVVSLSSSGGGGMSISSSPSRSDQFASSTAQTQQVLSMSSSASTDTGGSSSSFVGGSSSSASISIIPMPTFDSTPQIVMADVQVTDMQGEIDTAVGGVMTASEADQVADQIIADNIKEQQEAGQSTQEETGEYGDQSTLVAFMGYVPGFDAYREVQIPQQETWYEPRAIYGDVSISDNIEAFYGLARTNINTMQSLINQQPNL